MTRQVRWHLGHLDALRGIAVLGVLMVHSALELNLSTRKMELAFTGQRGVQLFFIVSAFTLFLSYDNRRDEAQPLRNFFLRRFFRLAPMFYLATIAACILTPVFAGPRFDVLLSVFFLHGFYPPATVHGAVGGWSVAVEAIFYICLPFLFRRIRTLNSAMLWLFIAAPILYRTSRTECRYFPNYAEYLQFFGFPIEFPVFLMGITAYFLWKEQIATSSLPLLARKQISILMLAFAACMFVLNLPFNYQHLYFSSAVCMLLLVALCIHPWSLFVNRVTIFLGKISFSLYLVHIHLLLFFRNWIKREGLFALHPTVRFACIFSFTLATATLLATATWLWIEEPGIRMGRRLIAFLEGQAPAKKVDNLVPPLKSVTGTGNSPDAQF